MKGFANVGIVAGISLREGNARSWSCVLTGSGNDLKILTCEIVIVEHSKAATDFDRLMKAAHGMSPASLNVCQGARLQLEVDQCIVERSAVAMRQGFRINLPDLAKRPAQEIQIVDQEIQDDTTALFRIGKPRFRARVPNTARKAYRTDLSDVSCKNSLAKPGILPKKPQNLANDDDF